MTRISARAAVAAAFSLGFAGLAQAVPVYFDFTGTIDGAGTAISGGFNFESDRLLFAGPPMGGQYTFVDWQPVGADLPAAFLSFGGQDVTFPSYEGHYSLINFVDQCASNPCGPSVADNFNLQAHTNDIWTPDYTGTLRSRFLIVLDYDVTNLDFIDGATAVPTDIVSLPLSSLFGIYSESVQDCVAGNCTVVSDNSINFSLDTVTRGVGARAVPEPGTLGLLGAGLLAMAFVRRRILSISGRSR